MVGYVKIQSNKYEVEYFEGNILHSTKVLPQQMDFICNGQRVHFKFTDRIETSPQGMWLTRYAFIDL